MKKTLHTFSNIVIMLFLISAISNAALAKDTTPTGSDKTRILFIGNSYTYWLEDILNKTLKESAHRDKAEFSFLTRGSTGLSEFASDIGNVGVKVMSGDWDYVVLQEWSQGVGSSPENTKTFNRALYRFREYTGDRHPAILYMTWGRDNPRNYKNYKDMHKKISRGYRDAAYEHNMKLAPVGLVWHKVRTELEKSGRASELYEDEIGHPSSKGQAIIASVFFKFFFNDDLAWLAPKLKDDFTEEEWQFVIKTVNKVMKKSKAYKPNKLAKKK